MLLHDSADQLMGFAFLGGPISLMLLLNIIRHDRRLLSLSVLPTETIYDLQELIFPKRGQALLQCAPGDLTLTKVFAILGISM